MLFGKVYTLHSASFYHICALLIDNLTKRLSGFQFDLVQNQ